MFPLANKIFLGNRQDIGSSGGSVYGLDLIGACAGALLVGTILIPVAGIPATCFMTAALNAAALFVSALSQKKGNRYDS
jgi:spermidine synthase